MVSLCIGKITTSDGRVGGISTLTMVNQIVALTAEFVERLDEVENRHGGVAHLGFVERCRSVAALKPSLESLADALICPKASG